MACNPSIVGSTADRTSIAETGTGAFHAGNGMGMGWEWDGNGMGMGWEWDGNGMGMGWEWDGNGMGMGWDGNGMGMGWEWGLLGSSFMIMDHSLILDLKHQSEDTFRSKTKWLYINTYNKQWLNWLNMMMLPNRRRTIREHCLQHQIYWLIYIGVYWQYTLHLHSFWLQSIGRCLILETCKASPTNVSVPGYPFVFAAWGFVSNYLATPISGQSKVII